MILRITTHAYSIGDCKIIKDNSGKALGSAYKGSAKFMKIKEWFCYANRQISTLNIFIDKSIVVVLLHFISPVRATYILT